IRDSGSPSTEITEATRPAEIREMVVTDRFCGLCSCHNHKSDQLPPVREARCRGPAAKLGIRDSGFAVHPAPEPQNLMSGLPGPARHAGLSLLPAAPYRALRTLFRHPSSPPAGFSARDRSAGCE